MKNEALLSAIGQAKSDYILEAQELRSGETKPHKSGKTVLWKCLLAAAMVSLLMVTAYAEDFLNIRTLTSGSVHYVSSSYEKTEKAMEKAGFRMDLTEQFENGYRFDRISVQDTVARDEEFREVLTYRDIDVTYQNPSGHRLSLHAYQKLEEIPMTDHDAALTRVIGGISADYYLDHYKNVPADYQPTQEDILWEQQPGNFISYGVEEVEETDVSFLCWEKDGICYSIMDMGAQETPDTLFAMAAALIAE